MKCRYVRASICSRVEVSRGIDESRCRTSGFAACVLLAPVRSWNDLSCTVLYTGTLNVFKGAVKRWLLPWVVFLIFFRVSGACGVTNAISKQICFFEKFEKLYLTLFFGYIFGGLLLLYNFKLRLKNTASCAWRRIYLRVVLSSIYSIWSLC